MEYIIILNSKMGIRVSGQKQTKIDFVTISVCYTVGENQKTCLAIFPISSIRLTLAGKESLLRGSALLHFD